MGNKGTGKYSIIIHARLNCDTTHGEYINQSETAVYLWS